MDLWSLSWYLSFSQHTGRRESFLLKEQICNCSGVPSNNANSVILQTRKYVREIRTGADLQIFLEKENDSLLPSFWKKLMFKPIPLPKKICYIEVNFWKTQWRKTWRESMQLPLHHVVQEVPLKKKIYLLGLRILKRNKPINWLTLIIGSVSDANVGRSCF